MSFLEQVRWPKGFQCQKCGHSLFWQNATGLRQCRSCEFKNSVKTNSIFEKSKLELKTWFYAIWWVTSQKNGVSASGLQRSLGLGSYRSAWLLLHKIRNTMVLVDRSHLSGEIEVDEAFLGGVRSGKRGRGADGKQLIVIAAEIAGIKKLAESELNDPQMLQPKALRRLSKKILHPNQQFILTDGKDTRI